MKPFPVRTERGQVWVALRRRSPTGPWWYDFSLKGQRYRDTTKTTVEAEARGKAASAVESAIVAAGYAPLTLRQLCDQCLDSLWPEHARKRRQAYFTHRRCFELFCETNGVEIVAGLGIREFAAMAQRFLDMLTKEGRAAQTLVNNRVYLSRLCSWAIQRRLVPWDTNPVNRNLVPRPVIPQRKPVGIEDAHLRILLKHAPSSRVWPAVVLCLGIGLRVIEAERVLWQHIDFKGGRIRAYGKRRERVIALPPWAARELKKIQARVKPKPDDMVTTFITSTLHHELKALRIAHGLPSTVTYQRMRQTAAKRAAHTMSTIQYANHFGHSLSVAHAHYIGYGITGEAKALSALDFGVTKTVTKKRRLPMKKK